MTEMNNNVSKNEIDNNAVDDIFGMIGTKPEQLKSDIPFLSRSISQEQIMI